MGKCFCRTVQLCIVILCMLVFLSGFEGLQKAFTKAKSVVEKEGSTPVFYIRTLTELEDFVMGVCKQTGKYMFYQTTYSIQFDSFTQYDLYIYSSFMYSTCVYVHTCTCIQLCLFTCAVVE